MTMSVKPYQVYRHISKDVLVDIRRIFGIFVEYRLRGGAGELFVSTQETFEASYTLYTSNEPVELRDKI